MKQNYALFALLITTTTLAAQNWPDRSTLPIPLSPFEGKIGNTSTFGGLIPAPNLDKLASFGITLDHSAAEHCDGHSIPGFKPVCVDGCFNHGLNVLLRAIEGAAPAEER